MVNIIRRFQKPLMIAITVIVSVGMIYLFNSTQYGERGGSDRVATIYGKSVSFAQAQRASRKYDVSQQLGLRDFDQALAGGSDRESGNNFVWNTLVLKHEAKELNVEPTGDDVVAAIQGMQVFQTAGQFDSNRYNMIVQVLLAPRGFTTDDMEDLIRDDLRIKKIKAVLASTIAPSGDELRTAYAQIAQKTEPSVIRLALDTFQKAVQVSDDDVKKLYEERKATLKTDELRKVKYVAFVLPATDKPLEPKQRTEELGKLSKQAEDFSVAMTEKGAKLDEVAAKLGAKIAETSDFSSTQTLPQFGEASEAVSAAAFKLTEKDPNSDVVTGDHGYYVLQLAGVTAPRPLTLDEAKAHLTDDLKHDRAQEALNLKATEIRNKIETDLKAGKSFADAATAAGEKAEAFPAFSAQDHQAATMAPNSGQIMETADQMNEESLSKPIPTADGTVIIYVGKRAPFDDTKYQADKPKLVQSFTQFNSDALFQEWLKLRRSSAQLNVVHAL